MPPFTPYRTEAEIEEVLQRFETCTYTPEEFFHARHLTVAAWYFLKLDTKTADERMRAGLLKFIRRHGKNGYHETITEFWLRLVAYHIRRHARLGRHSAVPVYETINAIVERLNDKGLIQAYYSRELLASPDAKARWVAPDLAPLAIEAELF
jgi:hypothetical protein